MELKLIRKYSKVNYTIGELRINDIYFTDCLEDPVRDLNKDGDLLDEGEGKIPCDTAIPYGTYDIILSMSPKFKRVLPLLLDVLHFTGIRIHAGTKSDGCLIIGENTVPGKVINGKKYETKLIQMMLDAIYNNESIWIIIT